MQNLFGINLRRLRKAANLRQDDLALKAWPGKSLKAGRVQISKYENGDMVPRSAAQEELAAALGCRVSDFWREVEAADHPEEPVRVIPSPPADQLDGQTGHGEQFEVWAEDQLMELARRSMGQVRVAVAERDQCRATLEQYKNEAVILRAEVERLRLELAAQIRLNQEARDRVSLLEGTSVPTVKEQVVGMVQEEPRGNENGERGE
jgi:transcriptional regulator with XRE-family HTH domain